MCGYRAVRYVLTFSSEVDILPEGVSNSIPILALPTSEGCMWMSRNKYDYIIPRLEALDHTHIPNNYLWSDDTMGKC